MLYVLPTLTTYQLPTTRRGSEMRDDDEGSEKRTAKTDNGINIISANLSQSTAKASIKHS
jgi:hypothetical protein